MSRADQYARKALIRQLKNHKLPAAWVLAEGLAKIHKDSRMRSETKTKLFRQFAQEFASFSSSTEQREGVKAYSTATGLKRECTCGGDQGLFGNYVHRHDCPSVPKICEQGKT